MQSKHLIYLNLKREKIKLKKYIKVISIVVILFFVLTACKSSVMNYVNQETTTRDMSDTSQNSKEATNNIKSRNSTELEKSAETKKTEETKGILPLADEDFLLSDGKNVLELGLVFKNFSSPEPGKGSDYVGQSYNGDQPYDVYVHYYKDFDIFISDMGKGEVPPYTAPIIIEQIYLNTKKYKTNRGISIGLKKVG